jgi:hypothetical protein
MTILTISPMKAARRMKAKATTMKPREGNRES